jgi:hypothetical protein
MGMSLWAADYLILNYERVAAKPVGEPEAQRSSGHWSSPDGRASSASMRG